MEFTLTGYPDHSDELPEAAARRTLRRAMPTARQRHHTGHGTVLLAVRLPLGRRAGAKMKIRMSWIAKRPAAGFRGKRIDLFGGGGDGQVWVGKGFRRRLDEERSRRPR